MWKSTLALLIVFSATLLLERQALHERALPFAGVVAVLLALSVTLALGSVQGILEAVRRKSSPETSPSGWKDGELIRVGGHLQGLGTTKRAPWTGREVLLYWYEAFARPDAQQAGANAPAFRGADAAPMELVTATQTLALVGVPNPRHLLPEASFQDDEKHAEAAQHLATTAWTTAPEIAQLSATSADAGLSTVPLHLLNRSARLQLDVPADEARTPAHFLTMLRRGRWFYRERALQPGDEVTVTGTFREHPPRIDIGMASAAHEVLPGLPARTASGNLVSTLAFAIALALIAMAAHYFVYGQASALYLQLFGHLAGG
jgi:hypothetical protein